MSPYVLHTKRFYNNGDGKNKPKNNDTFAWVSDLFGAKSSAPVDTKNYIDIDLYIPSAGIEASRDIEMINKYRGGDKNLNNLDNLTSFNMSYKKRYK